MPLDSAQLIVNKDIIEYMPPIIVWLYVKVSRESLVTLPVFYYYPRAPDVAAADGVNNSS